MKNPGLCFSYRHTLKYPIDSYAQVLYGQFMHCCYPYYSCVIPYGSGESLPYTEHISGTYGGVKSGTGSVFSSEWQKCTGKRGLRPIAESDAFSMSVWRFRQRLRWRKFFLVSRCLIICMPAQHLYVSPFLSQSVPLIVACIAEISKLSSSVSFFLTAKLSRVFRTITKS